MTFPRPKRRRWREHQCNRIADGIARQPAWCRWLAAVVAAIGMQRAFGERIRPEWDILD